MNEVRGNLWEGHPDSSFVVITTNGTIKHDGSVVMGRGCAKEAVEKFKDLPIQLGHAITVSGNIPFVFPEYQLATFPVKHNWWEKADIELITSSLQMLIERLADVDMKINLPRPGCGNGNLSWTAVKPIIEPYLDSRYTIYHYG